MFVVKGNIIISVGSPVISDFMATMKQIWLQNIESSSNQKPL